MRRSRISQRLLCEVHEALMAGVRGQERQPGTIRTSPVWIGASSHRIEDALHVPPLHTHIPGLLRDWEDFVNDHDGAIPALVRCALMHYQFETIHPFLDGNGRIGRLLVGLMLVSERKLTRPLLYLSGYLETYRSEYYERLQAVRERGEIQQWCRFFLQAVKAQADDGIRRATALVSLREKYTAQAQMDRSRASAVLPLVFRNPFISTKDVQRATGLSNQGARSILQRAEQYGWVTPHASIGKGGRTVWVAEEVLAIIDGPTGH